MIEGKTHPAWFNFRNLLLLILLASFAYSLFIVSRGWYNPILDKHEFRQTQTALSVYWMLTEGHLLAYQTPIFGSPWTVPFEFPLYQWIVAATYLLTKMPVDQCGKLVSIVFFYMTLIPVYSLIRNFKFDVKLFLVFSILFLGCPVYLFWSRTFMIESLSLFLSLSYVALIQQYLTTSRTTTALFVILAGSLASLVKVTTFIPSCIFAGGLIAHDYSKNFGRRINRNLFSWSLMAAFFVVIPIILCISWTNFADMIKLNSGEMAASLASNQLNAWVFGPGAQKTSYALWSQTILKSIYLNIGKYTIVLYGVAACVLFRSRETMIALWSLLCFLSSFLIFTNLYVVHDYYQYENAIFLIIFSSLIIFKLASSSRFFVFGLVLLLSTISLQHYSFLHFAFDPEYKPPYRSVLNEDTTRNRDFVIGNFIDKNVSHDSAIVVYGNDWRPTITYYSKRKSLTDHLRGDYTHRLRNIKGLLGGKAIGAIVVCSPNELENDETAKKLLARITDGSLVAKLYNAKVYYFPGINTTQGKAIELNRNQAADMEK